MGFPWGKIGRTASTSLAFLTIFFLAGCGGGGSGGGDSSSKNVAPTAAFTSNVTTGEAPLDVDFDAGGSSDTDGTIAAYAWNFGDGETGAGANPSHTFAAADTYIVLLTVTDDDGATDTVQHEIIVTDPGSNAPPIPDFTATPGTGPAPLDVSFDASASHDTDGTLTGYQWDFGDGSVTGAGVTIDHTFADAGTYPVTLTVTDDGGDSEVARQNIVVTSAGNHPPTAAFTATPATGTAPLSVDFDGTGSSDTDGALASYAWDFGDGTTDTGPTPSHTFTAAGTYTVLLTVTDDDDATDTAQAQITAQSGASDTTAPTVTLTAPVTGATLSATVSLTATAADDTGVDRVEFSVDGAVLSTDTAAPYEASLDTTPYGDGFHALSATAYDGAGNSHSDGLSVTFQNGTVIIPPAPDTVASVLPKTESTPLVRATSFLYTGSDPIQTGVVPGTIEEKRAAVLRGKVLAQDGTPLGGVRIRVLNHTEFGQTVSRSDGMFDLAVNGGGYLTVTYAKTGFLTAHRQVDVPWEDYRWLPDVVLLSALDAPATEVTLDEPAIQTARGSVVSDADGTRQSTLLIPPATTAEIVLADGTTQAVTSLHIRSTEYTVGENGPQAMPAPLPPYSGYTYAVELSADEVPEGAELVFSQPLVHYVENFIGFPVGSAVPTGYYDRKQGAWIAAENGRVIEILEIRGGTAILDTDGDGAEDDAATLAALDVTPEEQQSLAGLYPAAASQPLSLWRVPIPHFTPWDHNWPYGPPMDAELPERPPRKPEPKKPCKTGGSIIACQSQLLGEQIPVVGTSYSLVYSSDRVPGFTESRTLDIPITGDSWPASLERVDLEIAVAGRSFREIFTAQNNLEYRFTWDGLDAYGRAVPGLTPVIYQVCSTYPGIYYSVQDEFANAFNRLGGGPNSGITSVQMGRNILLCVQQGAVLGGLPEEVGIAPGWSLDRHHFWDAGARVLHLGNGDKLALSELYGTILYLSRRGNHAVTEGPAAEVDFPLHHLNLAISPSGELYVSSASGTYYSQNRGHVIFRIDGQGMIHLVAGRPGYRGYSGDGGPATEAQLDDPGSMAFGPDGSLFFYDGGRIAGTRRVRKIDPEGIITTVAGGGTDTSSFPDGVPALGATLGDGSLGRDVSQLDVGVDGSLYLVLRNYACIRRVGTDGLISTVAGICRTGGAAPYWGDGGPATEAVLPNVGGLAVAADGSFYLTTVNTVRKVTPDGLISTVAGMTPEATTGFTSGFSGDGGPGTEALLSAPRALSLADDGTLYIADTGNNRIRRLQPNGIITTVAGNGAAVGVPTGGEIARLAPLPYLFDLTVGGDGSTLYVSSYSYTGFSSAGDQYGNQYAGSSIIQVGPRRVQVLQQDDLVVPSEDGGELYVFDYNGRHLQTLNAVTGAILYEMTYDGEKRLVALTDGDGNVTVIERDAAGVATAIIAPTGQRTELAYDLNGYLAGITNQAGETTAMTYGPDGLLATFATPSGAESLFEYDSLGRLTRDTGPDGGFQAFSRTETDDGYTVAKTTAEGRVTEYTMTQLPDESRSSRVTYPDGSWMETVSGTDALQTVTYSDGTVITQQFGPDPRFGMLAPVVTSSTVTAPSGLSSVTTQTVTATYDPTDATVLTALDTQMTVDGRVTDYHFDVATRTLTTTEPDGTVTTSVTDDLGRVVEVQPAPGIDPLVYTYNTFGLLTRVAQGTSQIDYTYDEFDQVDSVTDPLGNAEQYAYDAANRMTELTEPAGTVYGIGYNADGRRTAVTMPSSDAHQLTYSAGGLLTGYDPPDLGLFEKTYNRDGDLTVFTLPSGATVTNGYDPASGFQVSSVYPSATTTLTYAPNSNGRLASMTHAPVGASTPQTTAYAYDGGLLTDITYGGVADGHFGFTYSTLAYPDAILLESGSDSVNLALTWNDALALTGVGDFTWNRSGPAGQVSSIGDAGFTRTLTYDSAGRIDSSAVVVNGTTVYAYDVTRDAGGLIVQKDETTDGAHTYAYSYDANGRLSEVVLDQTQPETYGYDANGNRTLASGVAATFSRDDAVTAVGTTAYAYDLDGHLTQRGDLQFTYSAVGELLAATLADASVIQYAYDGMGRRVARTSAAGTRTYLYGNPDVPYQVTALRAENGVLHVYYYDEDGVLYALDRGAERFYIGCDPVGTPKVVADATGAVVLHREFDAWGRLLTDSNPGFLLPFGLAGGLYDPDTQLVRFWHRDLDTLSGHWTTHDPALYGGGQFNLTQYAGADPVNGRDPTGLWCIGFNAYIGLGGGLQVCCSGGICSACGEIGVGFGIEGTVGSGGPERDGKSGFAEAGYSCGGAGVGLKCKSGDCGPSCGAEVQLADYKLDTSGNVGHGVSPLKCGPSIKAGRKNCERW